MNEPLDGKESTREAEDANDYDGVEDGQVLTNSTGTKYTYYYHCWICKRARSGEMKVTKN